MLKLLTMMLLSQTSYIAQSQFYRNRFSIIQPGYVRSRTFSRLGSEKPKIVLDSSRPLPCCQDESGGAVCRSWKMNNPTEFLRKCNTEPDFSLVVCCKSCNDATVDYKERGALFFNTKNNTSLCFDRMSVGYCSKFQSSSDAWSGKRWSCNSKHFRLGFRVCRQSCGFCSMDWRNSPDPVSCVNL